VKESFAIHNIRCGGCENSIKKALIERFPDIEVSSVSKNVITDIKNSEDRDYLINTLRSLGYPLIGDELGSFKNLELKAKSFVSCAVGKFGN